MDRQRVEDCLARVAAYRASGQKAKVWAQANGMELGTLGSWCAHAGRWRARLDGTAIEPSAATRSSGFVAARVAPSGTSNSVRIELNSGASRLELHWPLAHTRELAALLRELGR
tara:strand:+ start:72 stop:413 length:342 start_codon:yes stop_codon:yes gene_type:complete